MAVTKVVPIEPTVTAIFSPVDIDTKIEGVIARTNISKGKRMRDPMSSVVDL